MQTWQWWGGSPPLLDVESLCHDVDVDVVDVVDAVDVGDDDDDNVDDDDDDDVDDDGYLLLVALSIMMML